MSGYSIRLVGNEMTDTFPWALVDKEGNIIERSTHRAIVDQMADRLNAGHVPASIYDVDETDEMLFAMQEKNR